MDPNLERLTFVIILIPLAQLCEKNGMNNKSVVLKIGAVLFFISWFLHTFGFLK